MAMLLQGSMEGGAGLGDLLLVLAIVTFVIFAPYLIRRTRRRTQEEALRGMRPDPEGQKLARNVSDRALVDLLETSREISAQIDTKIRVLNKLVKDADRQARRLETLHGLEPGSTLPALDAEAEVAAQPETKEAVPEAPLASVETAPETDTPDAPPSPAPDNGQNEWRTEVYRRIEALHGNGFDAAAIARSVRMSTAEVNLVLHLLRERGVLENGRQE